MLVDAMSAVFAFISLVFWARFLFTRLSVRQRALLIIPTSAFSTLAVFFPILALTAEADADWILLLLAIVLFSVFYFSVSAWIRYRRWTSMRDAIMQERRQATLQPFRKYINVFFDIPDRH